MSWIEEKIKEQKDHAAQHLTAHGSRFFGMVFEELKRNVAGLPKIGGYGQVSNLSVPGEAQQRCRLDIGIKGKLRGITYTDLFYSPDENAIQIRTMESEAETYRFCILAAGEIGVVADCGFKRLTARELADKLAKEAFERLETAPFSL